jgi:HK97 family phage portal protein
LKSLKDRIDQKALSSGQYVIDRGQLVSLTDNGSTYINGAYNVNDIVYSIINIILDKVRLPGWGLYEVDDVSSLKSYYSYQAKNTLSAKEYRESLKLRTKALTPVKNPGKWGDLLTYPNQEQTFTDFVTQGCGYKLLTGNKFIYANILEGGANAGLPQELLLMPSQYVQLLVTQGFPSRVTGYQLSAIMNSMGFSKEQVLHEKYSNYSWSVNGEQHYGIAPLKAALRLTNRNNSALEASTAKFQNGGLDAIIYVDDTRIDNTTANAQAAAVKSKLISEYTGPVNQGKIVSSGMKMGVANLGLSPVELDIIQAEKWDMRRFCNVFGIPSQLLNDPENKSYNNAKEGEKALTTRCALPLLTSFRDNLNRKAHTDWKLDKRYVIDFDMSVFSELQEDIKEVADWTSKLIAISPNEQRELSGLATIDDKALDEVWVQNNGRVPLTDFQGNAVDQALNDQQP